MTKPILRKAPAKDIPISHPLTQLYDELDTLRFEIAEYSDQDLYLYCQPQIELYKHEELDRLYSKLVQTQKLDADERAALEAFCILSHSELFLTV